MKHEKTFQKVRKLIDERELDDANLETARDELFAVVEKDSEAARAYGLLSEINYWLGELADDSEDKIFFFNEGVECGKEGIAIDENSVEANFWLAANYGSYGQEKGIMQSLALVKPIKETAEKVVSLDESYFYGGAHRVLGRLYHKAPSLISIGNIKKAIQHLEKAVEIGPKFFLNRIFLAEAYISTRDKDKAREHLNFIIENPANENHEIEDEDIKRQAETLLANL